MVKLCYKNRPSLLDAVEREAWHLLIECDGRLSDFDHQLPRSLHHLLVGPRRGHQLHQRYVVGRVHLTPEGEVTWAGSPDTRGGGHVPMITFTTTYIFSLHADGIIMNKSTYQ